MKSDLHGIEVFSPLRPVKHSWTVHVRTRQCDLSLTAPHSPAQHPHKAIVQFLLGTSYKTSPWNMEQMFCLPGAATCTGGVGDGQWADP